MNLRISGTLRIMYVLLSDTVGSFFLPGCYNNDIQLTWSTFNTNNMIKTFLKPCWQPFQTCHLHMVNCPLLGEVSVATKYRPTWWLTKIHGQVTAEARYHLGSHTARTWSKLRWAQSRCYPPHRHKLLGPRPRWIHGYLRCLDIGP